MNREKYLRSVRRRLNMPKALKDRVMEDFISSIDARMEDGQEEATVLAELGTPKEAARELNRQMEEYTFRKSPWRWVCLGFSVLSALCLAYQGLTGLLLMLFTKTYNTAASIGVIGGADGPTSIFIATSNKVSPTAGVYALVLILSIVGFILLSRLTRK